MQTAAIAREGGTWSRASLPPSLTWIRRPPTPFSSVGLRSRRMALDPKISFRDPAAGVVWAAMCTLEEGAQHELLAALGERLAFPEERPTPHGMRVARGVAALREAVGLLGHSPSVGEYRRLRDQHPEHRWPDDRSVRQWLGGNWNDALATAGLDALPDPIAHHRERGPDLSDEECLAALRECAADLESQVHELSFPRYVNWARRADVRKRVGRRPQGQLPFERFGGWRAAKASAMGVEDGSVAGADGHGYRYTDEEIFSTADEIAARLGKSGCFPRPSEWHRERRGIVVEEKQADKPPRALASMKVVRRRFKTWQAAEQEYLNARAGGGGPEAAKGTGT